MYLVKIFIYVEVGQWLYMADVPMYVLYEIMILLNDFKAF